MQGQGRPVYIPELDGLRAIAVMAVVFAHAHVFGFSGAGRGVDAFFALSGFLITRLLAHELESTDRVDLRGFWMRRVLRLAPALVVFVGVVTLFAPAVRTQRSAAIPSLLYYANWHRAFSDDLSALGHTWSLAIEEQFYFVWPIALWALYRLDRTFGVAQRICVVVAVASASARVFAIWQDVPVRHWYHNTFMRADAIMLGCAFALYVHRHRGVPDWMQCRRVVTAATAVVVGVLVARERFDPLAMLSVEFTVVAIATLAVVGAAVSGADTRAMAALRHPVAVWLGVRSYAIYLWHYPILWLGWIPAGGQNVLWRIGLTLVAADLSFRFVEQPFLAMKRRWAAPSAVASLPAEVLVTASDRR